MFDWFEKATGFKHDLPNRFSTAMGELIRRARTEAKISQAELAEKAYFRQAAISQIETGKREVSASEIVYLSYALNKPITYFFPSHIVDNIGEQELTELEKDLIYQTRRLDGENLVRLIAQAKALADLAEL